MWVLKDKIIKFGGVKNWLMVTKLGAHIWNNTEGGKEQEEKKKNYPKKRGESERSIASILRIMSTFLNRVTGQVSQEKSTIPCLPMHSSMILTTIINNTYTDSTVCQSALRLSVYWPTSCSQQWIPLTVPLTAEETQAQRVMCSRSNSGQVAESGSKPSQCSSRAQAATTVCVLILERWVCVTILWGIVPFPDPLWFWKTSICLLPYLSHKCGHVWPKWSGRWMDKENRD